VSYSSQSLWTGDTVCLIHTQSLASSSCDSVLHPVLTVIDSMISVLMNQVSAAILCLGLLMIEQILIVISTVINFN